METINKLSDVLISEVGPRDGLQSIKTIMDTDHKKKWLSALCDSGIKEIECCSFVPPKLLPQMADANEIVQYCKSLSGWHVMGLVPNLQGVKDAIAAGVDKVTFPLSASNAHSVSNLRKTCKEAVDELAKIVSFCREVAPEIKVEVGISTAFGCTLQGNVPESDVINLAVKVVELGVNEVGLSDTTGYANPSQVKRLFRRLRSEIGEKTGGAHMHNTRGLGLANCLAAYEEGVRIFDASHGGLGGCPYAPGASGNVVTEDLVFMFESMGIKTGIDIVKLLDARQFLKQGLPDEVIYGMVPEAGLPKGFVQS